MVSFTTSNNFNALTFQEQCLVALIELLDRVAEGKETKARVGVVISELHANVPWALHGDEVSAIIDEVAKYGPSALPGYVLPEEGA